MNETTIHGNLARDPELHHGRENRPVLVFTVAVNGRWYNTAKSRWEDKPTVWHKVVAFGELAENGAQTLTRGMTVTVTGELVDDSYTPNGWDKPLSRIKLEARDIAVSLRWATATVTRRPRRQDQSPEPTEPTEPTGQPAEAT